ncbi:hypothetical protein ACPEIC_30545 [Stenotrophomonas sp. NPDC087984]
MSLSPSAPASAPGREGEDEEEEEEEGEVAEGEGGLGRCVEEDQAPLAEREPFAIGSARGGS